MGRHHDSYAAYNLSGDGILKAQSLIVCYLGYGAFTQSGGTNTVTGDLTLGYDIPGSEGPGYYGAGVYSLSSGSLQAKNLTVGAYGIGYFTQSGGTNNVTDRLVLGAARYGLQLGSGTYDLSGSGSLSTSNLYVGGLGSGTFTQSGGSVTIAPGLATSSALAIGTYPEGSGTYNMFRREPAGGERHSRQLRSRRR